MKTFINSIQILLLVTMLFSCSKTENEQLEVIENPSITALSQNHGAKNEMITVSGKNLTGASVEVRVDNLLAQIENVSETEIRFKVPARAFEGGVTISVDGNNFQFEDFAYQISEGTVSTIEGGIIPELAKLQGLALDEAGNLYVSDSHSHKIFKISTEGEVSVYAGNTAGDANGNAAEAQFFNPKGLVFDGQGNLFVADAGNHKIKKIASNGTVSTVAGSTEGDAEGSEEDAKFKHPMGLTIDGEGNLYVTDWELHKVKKVTPDGYVSDLAGSVGGYADGTGYFAEFAYPAHIKIAPDGFLYVAEQGYSGGLSGIRKISLDGETTTYAGTTELDHVDGTLLQSKFNKPIGIAIDSMGNMYIADQGNFKIRQISTNTKVSTIAGSTFGHEDGTGDNVKFSTNLTSMASGGNHTLYVCDDNSIRKIELE